MLYAIVRRVALGINTADFGSAIQGSSPCRGSAVISAVSILVKCGILTSGQHGAP